MVRELTDSKLNQSLHMPNRKRVHKASVKNRNEVMTNGKKIVQMRNNIKL